MELKHFPPHQITPPNFYNYKLFYQLLDSQNQYSSLLEPRKGIPTFVLAAKTLLPQLVVVSCCG